MIKYFRNPETQTKQCLLHISSSLHRPDNMPAHTEFPQIQIFDILLASHAVLYNESPSVKTHTKDLTEFSFEIAGKQASISMSSVLELARKVHFKLGLGRYIPAAARFCRSSWRPMLRAVRHSHCCASGGLSRN